MSSSILSLNVMPILMVSDQYPLGLVAWYLAVEQFRHIICIIISGMYEQCLTHYSSSKQVRRHVAGTSSTQLEA